MDATKAVSLECYTASSDNELNVEKIFPMHCLRWIYFVFSFLILFYFFRRSVFFSVIRSFVGNEIQCCRCENSFRCSFGGVACFMSCFLLMKICLSDVLASVYTHRQQRGSHYRPMLECRSEFYYNFLRPYIFDESMQCWWFIVIRWAFRFSKRTECAECVWASVDASHWLTH